LNSSPSGNAKADIPAPAATPAPGRLLSYVPPRPARQVVPQPRGLGVMLYRDTEVAVQVKVDPTGRVVAAQVIRDGASTSLSLENVALNAARSWSFEPARLRGQPVASDYTIRFQFRRNRY
jgi:TonB family protein